MVDPIPVVIPKFSCLENSSNNNNNNNSNNHLRLAKYRMFFKHDSLDCLLVKHQASCQAVPWNQSNQSCFFPCLCHQNQARNHCSVHGCTHQKWLKPIETTQQIRQATELGQFLSSRIQFQGSQRSQGTWNFKIGNARNITSSIYHIYLSIVLCLLCICMYVCMHVCMYVCKYVCT